MGKDLTPPLTVHPLFYLASTLLRPCFKPSPELHTAPPAHPLCILCAFCSGHKKTALSGRLSLCSFIVRSLLFSRPLFQWLAGIRLVDPINISVYHPTHPTRSLLSAPCLSHALSVRPPFPASFSRLSFRFQLRQSLICFCLFHFKSLHPAG